MWLTVGPTPNDQPALKPFLKSMEENLSFTYKNIVADAGYESEENYSWIEENGQIAFIKPANYERSKTREYQKDISRKEHMDYYPAEDYYLCKNRKSKAGYLTQTTIYRCEDCTDCPYKSSCTKANHWKLPLEERTKQLEVSRNFERQRSEYLERIVSDEGILLRINRSIQAEGSFADMKQDRNFRRYLCRGQKNVYAESVLMAISHNIEKLHDRIQKERTGLHLFCTEKAA